MELRTAEPTATPTPLDYGARRYPAAKVKMGLPPSVAIALIVGGSGVLVSPWILGSAVMSRFMASDTFQRVFQYLYPWGYMAIGVAMIVLGYLKSLRPIS